MLEKIISKISLEMPFTQIQSHVGLKIVLVETLTTKTTSQNGIKLSRD
jgi:hypothetical protein